MKKKVLLSILFLLLFPSVVLAKDTCNNNDINIEEIKVEEKEGYPEELTPVSIDNNKINLNLEMYNVGESITYKIKVKNNSNNDYYFTKDSFNLNTDYLEYSLLNNSEVIKSNEEKEIELKIIYKEKIPEDEFNENNRMSITLSDTPLSNPSTKRTLISILLIVGATIILTFVGEKKLIEKFMIGIIVLLTVPLITHALCTINLEINSNIIINNKEAIFLPGREVNTKMKQLAGSDSTSHGDQDTNIVAIKYSSTEPIDSNKEEKNLVSTSESPYPIYMWYEESIIYWWSEDKRPNLNENSSYMFYLLKKLEDISDFSMFDAANVTNMRCFLGSASSLTTLTGLENWDTSNVTDLESSFISTKLTTLEELRNWNTSKVESLQSAFWGAPLTSIEALSNWNVSNVINMRKVFVGTKLASLNGLENWDTSNVTQMGSMFFSSPIESLEPLKKWNTSNLNETAQMFVGAKITNLKGLEDWDVSNVSDMRSMFWGVRTIVDASAINDWNIQPTALFTDMFSSVPTHPEFSKVPGTWSNGTFTPTP